jgi:large subunit ribosomal protein L30
MAQAKGKTVTVKLIRSGIGTPKDQRATLKGLGLSRINQERSLVDTPALRGMIFKVRHLVSADPPGSQP